MKRILSILTVLVMLLSCSALADTLVTETVNLTVNKDQLAAMTGMGDDPTLDAIVNLINNMTIEADVCNGAQLMIYEKDTPVMDAVAAIQDGNIVITSSLLPTSYLYVDVNEASNLVEMVLESYLQQYGLDMDQVTELIASLDMDRIEQDAMLLLNGLMNGGSDALQTVLGTVSEKITVITENLPEGMAEYCEMTLTEVEMQNLLFDAIGALLGNENMTPVINGLLTQFGDQLDEETVQMVPMYITAFQNGMLHIEEDPENPSETFVVQEYQYEDGSFELGLYTVNQPAALYLVYTDAGIEMDFCRPMYGEYNGWYDMIAQLGTDYAEGMKCVLTMTEEGAYEVIAITYTNGMYIAEDCVIMPNENGLEEATALYINSDEPIVTINSSLASYEVENVAVEADTEGKNAVNALSLLYGDDTVTEALANDLSMGLMVTLSNLSTAMPEDVNVLMNALTAE